jgi:Zn-dependent metalloprotease
MSHRLWLTGTLCGASLFAAACGQTASDTPELSTPEVQSVQLFNKTRAKIGPRTLEAAAIEMVNATPELTAVGDEWRPRNEATPGLVAAKSPEHARLQQLHDGVPVFGADIVVHAAAGVMQNANGNFVKGLEGFDVAPTFMAAAALDAAKAEYAKQAKDAVTALSYARVSNQLVILPRKGSEPRLAWHVVFFTEYQAGIAPGLWNTFVDAKTGQMLWRFNGLDTLSQASGPGGNAKVARTWTNALDVEPSGAQFMMDTARLQTLNMNNGTAGGTVVTGPLSPIGDAPINDAHGFAEVTLNVLQDWGGYNSIDNLGFKIISRVHYSTAYENAFWDGAQMTYGDGATTFFPLSGDVDVVAHEIHHGFTTFHSNLVYANQSGGMNEAFSDIMGTTAEFYSEGLGADWDLGRDIFRGNTALRFMCNPIADGVSVDNFANYSDALDVHYSSGIYNKAFCRAARRIGSGLPDGQATVDSVRRTAKAFYEANANYWTSGSTMNQGCTNVITAATALAYTTAEIDAIKASFADVGLPCDGTPDPIVCSETLTGASGTITSPNFPASYPNNYSHTWCIQPASGAAATLHFTAFSTESGFDFVNIRNAAGQQLSNTSGAVAPADATSTLIVVKFTTDSSVVATGWSANWSTGGTTNTPPTAAITAPANGSTVAGVVNVTANAADADGTVARVRFELPDGTAVDDTTAPYSTSWNSATVANGAGYAIRATAFDNLGAASTVSTVTVSVANGTCINGRFSATDVPRAIPDNNTTGATSTLAVTGNGRVGTLTLSLNLTHPRKRDVQVTLTSPSGTSFVAFNRTGSGANVVLVDVPVTAFNGQTAAGSWRLKAVDNRRNNVGTINSWSLNIAGTCP